jgi:N-acetylmuramoyl-L-alanine amidase
MFGRFACARANFLLVLAGFFLFTGCPSTPKQSSRVTTLEALPIRSQFAAPIQPETALETVPVNSTPDEIPTRDRGEAVLPEESLQIPGGRLPFSSWAQLCGFTEIRGVANSNPPVFDLVSGEGTLTLVLGQRFARWNGITIGLGFPPVAERGQVVAHSIDVYKNFYPLGIGALSIPKKNRVLVLDPGHGGADPGTQSPARKALEKDLALDWALRIERLLANSSWQVLLTRRDDRDIPLLDRVAFTDARRADLFISLHFNSLESSGSGKTPDEAGIETYCLTPTGAPSNVTRNFEDDVRRVYPNNEYDAQNLLLACRVQSSLVAATGRRDRGVRRARFMTVVREQKRPAVLIEGGFLSNPAEVNLILQPGYREQMARAVCNALPN